MLGVGVGSPYQLINFDQIIVESWGTKYEVDGWVCYGWVGGVLTSFSTLTRLLM